jgi:hypothetical protein
MRFWSFVTTLTVDRVLAIAAILLTMLWPLFLPPIGRWFRNRSLERSKLQAVRLTMELHEAEEHPEPIVEMVAGVASVLYVILGIIFLPIALWFPFLWLGMPSLVGQIVLCVCFGIATMVMFMEFGRYFNQTAQGKSLLKEEIRRAEKKAGCKVKGAHGIFAMEDSPIWSDPEEMTQFMIETECQMKRRKD